MQTFLPLEGFAATAAVLDPKRLGAQRVEALQVLRALTVPGYGWRHHPAVRMWIGYPEALARYGLEICEVWRRAGRPDTCAVALAAELAERCRVVRSGGACLRRSRPSTSMRSLVSPRPASTRGRSCVATDARAPRDPARRPRRVSISLMRLADSGYAPRTANHRSGNPNPRWLPRARR